MLSMRDVNFTSHLKISLHEKNTVSRATLHVWKQEVQFGIEHSFYSFDGYENDKKKYKELRYLRVQPGNQVWKSQWKNSSRIGDPSGCIVKLCRGDR